MGDDTYAGYTGSFGSDTIDDAGGTDHIDLTGFTAASATFNTQSLTYDNNITATAGTGTILVQSPFQQSLLVSGTGTIRAS